MLPRSVPSHAPSSQRGAANRPVVALLSSAFLLVVLILALNRSAGPPPQLTIYCAAGLRGPMEAIRAAYKDERGVELTIQYGGSSTLLGNLRVNHDADVFLPADDSYMDIAKEDRLITQTFPIARMRPILAVKKGNPLAINSLSDLLTNKNVRISMTDPAAAATGKLVKEALEK